MLLRHFQHMGHNTTYKLTLKDGLKEASSNPYDIVLLDVTLPDGNGLEVLPKLRETGSAPEIIIITGAGSPDGAEIAVKSGAWDYLEKPLSPQKITLPLKRVIQYRDELKKAPRPAVALKLDGIVGSSPQMRDCFDFVAQAATCEASVLIAGETGTGKELFAQAVHANSGRADKPFVVVDCAALPETLVESSLFGHERGAFTGAEKSRGGMVKQADGGTLFLDEVGELPLPLQKAFLRVLQEHRFRSVGGERETESDFRLIAATNRDLDQMADSGRFRKDLLYRLRTIMIELPPLRERLDDIKELVLYYTAKISARYKMENKGFYPDFIDVLCGYEWPGNVRELVNTLEDAISKARHEPTLFPKHLPTHLRIRLARASAGKNNKRSANVTPPHQKALFGTPLTFRETRETVLSEMEENYFQGLMKLTHGSIKKSCEISGLSRNRLYIYLKRHNISRLGWH